jgi:hypothetical protein
MKWTVLAIVVGILPTMRPANAAGAFDGTYVGKARQTLSDNGGRCQKLSHDTRIVITDNAFQYRWVRVMEAKVQPDGSFYVSGPGRAQRGASPSVSIRGQIVGGNLEADVGGDRCADHLSLTKS